MSADQKNLNPEVVDVEDGNEATTSGSQGSSSTEEENKKIIFKILQQLEGNTAALEVVKNEDEEFSHNKELRNAVLCWAVESNNKEIVEEMIRMINDIGQDYEEVGVPSALALAAIYGHTEIAILLFNVYKTRQHDALMTIADATNDNTVMKAILHKIHKDEDDSVKNLHKKNVIHTRTE